LVIIFLAGSPFEGNSRERIQCQNPVTGLQVPDHLIYSSDISGVMNIACNEEENQGSGQHSLPSFQRFSLSAQCAEKVAELRKDQEISGFIHIAQTHVIRLEGPAIIHPFNYFW
jgi:hypothetical protein